MSLAEYLFVDETRLDSYFDQISSPVTFEKQPTWKAGVSLAGPVAEGAQSVFPRPFTRHEKICAVLDYLKENSQLRTPEESHAATFAFESLDATPVHIPLRSDAASKQDYLNLWVGTPKTGTGGYRFLLEGFSGKDDHQPAILSAFSCLQSMLDEFGETVRDFIYAGIDDASEGDKANRLVNESWDTFSRVLPLSPTARRLIGVELQRAGIHLTSPPTVIDFVQGDEIKSFWVAVDQQRYSIEMTPPEIIVRRERFHEANALLIRDPLPLFAQWGAKIGAQRSLDAFYRIRRAGRDAEDIDPVLRGLRNVRVVGYAILLTSHPGPFTDKYVEPSDVLPPDAKPDTVQDSQTPSEDSDRLRFFRRILSFLKRP